MILMGLLSWFYVVGVLLALMVSFPKGCPRLSQISWVDWVTTIFWPVFWTILGAFGVLYIIFQWPTPYWMTEEDDSKKTPD